MARAWNSGGVLVEGKEGNVSEELRELTTQVRVLDNKVERLVDLLEKYDHDAGKPSILARVDNLEIYLQRAFTALVIQGGLLIILFGYTISVSMR